MDIRQVALGAAFGAAVAVNAALQSLRDAGSFLVHSPVSRGPVDILDATGDVTLAIVDDEDFVDFTEIDDEDDEKYEGPGTLQEDGDVGGTTSLLPAAAESPNPNNSDLTPRTRSHHQLEDLTEPGNCPKRRKTQEPLPVFPFLPVLPPVVQTEETMSLMLQQTTDTVLNTLADAKGRRERMLNDLNRVQVSEKESSLKLVNSFIDALVNVSESLKIVQSALFVKKDGPP